MYNFCSEGEIENPKCYSTESISFPSEEQIFDILLDVLKSELPKALALVKDCQDEPMFISEEDIDLIPSGKESKFSVILNPLSDVPKYSDSLSFREVKYSFELFITASNTLARCVTWELIRFKNAIEGLVVGAEFAIDGYNSVIVEPEGFRYFLPGADSGMYRRQGAYRFSVTVTQYRN